MVQSILIWAKVSLVQSIWPSQTSNAQVSQAAHSPIFVVEASLLSGRKANTEIPVILAYDQSHYESLVPDTDKDIEKSIELKRSFLDGKYSKKLYDIPALMPQGTTGEKSYAKVVQGNVGDKGNSEKFVKASVQDSSRNLLIFQITPRERIC